MERKAPDATPAAPSIKCQVGPGGQGDKGPGSSARNEVIPETWTWTLLLGTYSLRESLAAPDAVGHGDAVAGVAADEESGMTVLQLRHLVQPAVVTGDILRDGAWPEGAAD